VYLLAQSESLEESDNLPDPDVLAQEIVEDLEAALEQFREIAGDLGLESADPPSRPFLILVIFPPTTGSLPIMPGFP
jgi:hypothetical protein